MSVVVTDNTFYHDTQTDTAPIIELKSGNGENLEMRKKHHILLHKLHDTIKVYEQEYRSSLYDGITAHDGQAELRILPIS
jgi:hypothetical protein